MAHSGLIGVGFERLTDILDELQGDPWLEFRRKGGHSGSMRERRGFDVGSGSGGSTGYQLDAKQRLANAIGAPQALVKIVRGGGTGSRGELATQLMYLSRDGDLTLDEYAFDGSDFFVEGQSDISDLSKAWAARWDRAELLDGRSALAKAKTYHLIVSFPEGMGETKAHEAADTFADRFLSSGEFGDCWSHVRAWHTDRAHPHMHIVVDRRGASGKMMQINPKRSITPSRLRALQVDAAAEHGLLMNDTPRISRGVRGRAPTSATWRTEQRGDYNDRNTNRRSQNGPMEERAFDSVRHEAQELRKLEETLSLSASLHPNNRTQIRRFAAALNDAAAALEQGKDLPIMDIQTLERDGITPDALAALTPNDLIQTIRNVITEAEQLSPRLADEDKRAMLEVETGKIKHLYSDRIPEFSSGIGETERDDGLLSPVIENRRNAQGSRDAAATSFAIQGTDRDGNDLDNLRNAQIASPSQTLDDADERVKQAYAVRGMNGDRALARIKGGLEATAETRAKWYHDEVRERSAVDEISPEQAVAEVLDLHDYASKLYRASARAIGRGVTLDAIEVYAPTDDFANQLRLRAAEEAALSPREEVQQRQESIIERADLNGLNADDGLQRVETVKTSDVGDGQPHESSGDPNPAEQFGSDQPAPKQRDTNEERRQHFAEIESRIAEEDARLAQEEGLDQKPGLRRGR